MLVNGPDAVAARVVAAAPELAPLLFALFLHAFEHRLAAFGAERSAASQSLSLTGFETFGGHIFGETARLPETLKPVLNL